jgi:hypothetical protein
MTLVIIITTPVLGMVRDVTAQFIVEIRVYGQSLLNARGEWYYKYLWAWAENENAGTKPILGVAGFAGYYYGTNPIAT